MDFIISREFLSIKRIQAKEEGLKLNVIHQFLVSADSVNILHGGLHTVNENTEAVSITV